MRATLIIDPSVLSHSNGLDDKSSNPAISTGGYQILLDGKSGLGDGWEARGHLDLLSSFAYRSEFSLSINEAVYTQTHSVAFIDKHWSDYAVNFVMDRNVDFQSTTPGDQVEIRKLPEADFIVRERQNAPITSTTMKSGMMRSMVALRR